MYALAISGGLGTWRDLAKNRPLWRKINYWEGEKSRRGNREEKDLAAEVGYHCCLWLAGPAGCCCFSSQSLFAVAAPLLITAALLNPNAVISLGHIDFELVGLVPFFFPLLSSLSYSFSQPTLLLWPYSMLRWCLLHS